MVELISAYVILAASMWACLAHKYDDGIIGKMLFFVAALLSVCVISAGKHGDWLHRVFALILVRRIIINQIKQ